MPVLLTTVIGPGQLIVMAKVDFDDTATVADGAVLVHLAGTLDREARPLLELPEVGPAVVVHVRGRDPEVAPLLERLGLTG